MRTKLSYHLNKHRFLFVLLAAILLLAVILGSLFLLDPYGCKIQDGVTIGGLPVGGLYPWQAQSALREASDALLEKELTIVLPEENLVFSQGELHSDVNSWKLVSAAFLCGRRDSRKEIPLTAGLSYREDLIEERLTAYASAHDTALSQAQYRLEGAAPALETGAYDPDAPLQTLILSPGTPECTLDIPSILTQIRLLYDKGFAQNALTLSYFPTTTALPDPLDLDAVYQAVAVPCRDDSLDREAYTIVPGSYGYAFDLEDAQAALDSAAWGQEVSLPMEITEPAVLGDMVYFQDVLGTCETSHNDNENRNTNLRLVCQTLDGLILQPGETFSYNAVIGERTEERGYKAAPAYSGTRLIQDIGGGVCQGSTTLYNCVLLADLEVLERVCHGYTVNYVPIGLDAAVNWATKTDFAFRNSWNFPIMIQAEVSDGYMRMKILGTDEKDYYVKMTSGYSEEELRIYANSYKYKYDKETGEQLSRELEARSSYMYFSS